MLGRDGDVRSLGGCFLETCLCFSSSASSRPAAAARAGDRATARPLQPW